MKLEDVDNLEKKYLARFQRRRAKLDSDEHVTRMAFEILRKQAEDAPAPQEDGENPESLLLNSCLELTSSTWATASRTIMGTIKGIIPHLNGPFTINTIREIIESDNPRARLNPTTISNHLRKLTEKGMLVLHEEGKGKTPSSYRRAELFWVTNGNGNGNKKKTEEANAIAEDGAPTT